MGSRNSVSKHRVPVSKAVEGFLKLKLVEGLADNSIAAYRQRLECFVDWAGSDCLISEVDPETVEDFIYWLKVEYRPKRFGQELDRPLSNKSLYGYYETLKTYFNWARGRGLVDENPMDTIPAPKCQDPPVNPLDKEEVKGILQATQFSKTVDRDGYKSFKCQRHNYRRDKAIVLTLLDTGLRASELCDLVIGDLNPKNGEIRVRQGKGGKDRTVFIGKAAQAAIWDYMIERDDDGPQAPLFVYQKGGPLNRDSLYSLIKRLARRADVDDCYPHKFRHTFAVNFLKNGGNIFALQRLLGHSTLDMVNHYLNIARADLQDSHRASSPVDNWGL